MYTGKTVFAQLMAHFSRYEFDKCVARYRGDHRVYRFSCLDQFFCMVFAQLTGRESLRDIETCLNFHGEKLYHMGFRGAVSCSTLASANERRDFLIFQDFAHGLIAIARKLYRGDPLALELKHTVYALDSTTIDQCLSLFPWAPFRKTKAAVKMHSLLDLRGSIPTFICVTTGKVHDVNLLDAVPLKSTSIVTRDRAYVEYQWLYTGHRISAYFVVRGKRNLRYRRISSRPVDKSSGVRADQTIALTVNKTRNAYPETPRRYLNVVL